VPALVSRGSPSSTISASTGSTESKRPMTVEALALSCRARRIAFLVGPRYPNGSSADDSLRRHADHAMTSLSMMKAWMRQTVPRIWQGAALRSRYHHGMSYRYLDPEPIVSTWPACSTPWNLEFGHLPHECTRWLTWHHEIVCGAHQLAIRRFNVCIRRHDAV
jgi:hypothetical protein